MKDRQGGYKTVVEGTPVRIHPSSVLFGRSPECFIYHELILTTREYCYNMTVIEPKWLGEVAPQFFKAADTNRISQPKKRGKRKQRVSEVSPLPLAAVMRALTDPCSTRSQRSGVCRSSA